MSQQKQVNDMSSQPLVVHPTILKKARNEWHNELTTKLTAEMSQFKAEERRKNRYWDKSLLAILKNDVLVPLLTRIRPPSGALLNGRPGIGKTKLAEFIMKFFHVIGQGPASEFFSEYIGGTEQKIREVADKCLQHLEKICIMFIDDLDSLDNICHDHRRDYKKDFLDQVLAIISSRQYPNLFLLADTNFYYKCDTERAQHDCQIVPFRFDLPDI